MHWYIKLLNLKENPGCKLLKYFLPSSLTFDEINIKPISEECQCPISSKAVFCQLPIWRYTLFGEWISVQHNMFDQL